MAFELPLGCPAIEELAGRRQWVCHDAKKIPICPGDGKPASSVNPKTWGSYDEAVSEAVHLKLNPKIIGVGFVFTDEDPYVGVDLDKCVDREGNIEEWAVNIIETLDSYTEISPSGSGLHVLIKGQIPGSRNRTGHLEMYSRARYFTVTGKPLDGFPNSIEERQGELNSVYDEYFPSNGNCPQPENGDGDSWVNLGVSMDTDKLVTLSISNLKFRKSWQHERNDLPDQSLSSYDLSLATLAAYADWNRDELVALIIAHRRKYGDVDKARRKDYLARVVDMAMKAKDAGIKDSKAVGDNSLNFAKGSGRDEILSEISVQMGVPLEGIIKRGMNPAIYYLKIAGEEICVGEARDIMASKIVREILFDATHRVMPMIKHERWLNICALFETIIEVDEKFSIDSRVETMDWVDEYLESKDIFPESEWGDALINDDPFEKDGHIWIHPGKLLSHLNRTSVLAKRMGKTGLLRRLREVGFEKRAFTAKGSGNKQIGRNYWGLKR